MNYRHIYHAGSFADVFKHIVLWGLAQSFHRKETPFCYLETHAGNGKYDLTSDAAQKAKEFTGGISKLINAANPPSLVHEFLACINKMNPANELTYYPGSPYFAQLSLRAQDRMLLSELHPDAFQTLKASFRGDKRVVVHHQDGYQSLKAYLPPKERRGLVLIDPPYEDKNELNAMPALLAQTLKRWETGVYALWYPIKDRASLELFHRELKNAVQRPLLITELCIQPEDVAARLNGSGMAIVNPPWQFDQQLEAVLPWLWDVLAVNKQGRFTVTTYTNTADDQVK